MQKTSSQLIFLGLFFFATLAAFAMPAPEAIEVSYSPVSDRIRPAVIGKAFKEFSPGFTGATYKCIGQNIYNSPLSDAGLVALLNLASPATLSQSDREFLMSDEYTQLVARCIPGGVVVNATK